jgi:succinate dehydrogenase / fumarate reductase membrane anchor subunit
MRLLGGQRPWVLQRVTALLLLTLVTLGAAALLVGPPLNYARWHAFATSIPGSLLIMALSAAVCLHAWVGMRDIVVDYVHPVAARLTILTLIALTLSATFIRITLVMAAHLSATPWWSAS